MQQLNETTYNEKINEDKLTLVKYKANWCGPCRVLAPALDSIIEKYPGVNFGEVDIDQNMSLAQKDNVRGVPAVIFYKNGKVLDTLVGLQPLQNYISRIESLS